MSLQIGLACSLSGATGAATADVSLISESGVGTKAIGVTAASPTGDVNIAMDGCQGLKLDYELQLCLYAYQERIEKVSCHTLPTKFRFAL
jgi:hypothetical protein